MRDPNDQMIRALHASYISAGYSDLEVICKSRVFHVHKLIVCTRSLYFKKAINFPGKESTDGQIDLSQEDPVMIERLIEYIYKNDYKAAIVTTSCPPHICPPRTQNGQCEQQLCAHHQCGTHCNHDCKDFTCKDCSSKPSSNASSAGSPRDLLVHAKMYEFGNYYCIPSLKAVALAKFKAACDKFWNDAIFAQAAHQVYSSCSANDTDLRDVVRTTICDKIVLIKKPEIEAVVLEFNLTMQILKDKMTMLDWPGGTGKDEDQDSWDGRGGPPQRRGLVRW